LARKTGARLHQTAKGLAATVIMKKPERSSGLRGVHCYEGKWSAVISRDGYRRYLGRFDSKEEAAALTTRLPSFGLKKRLIENINSESHSPRVSSKFL
jgi:hypothetical protein